MKRSVIVVHQNQNEIKELCIYLKSKGFFLVLKHSLEMLEKDSGIEDAVAIILDIDSIPCDNRSLQRLHCRSPATSILLTSSRKTHPDLEQTIGRCVYACIPKPFDLDEVDFLLNSILNDAS